MTDPPGHRRRSRWPAIRILYDGSVTADNAAGVLDLDEVGGLLIGGASLLAAEFDAVLRCLPHLRPGPG